MEQNNNRWWENIGRWLGERWADVSTGFAQAYAWAYDLPYEPGLTTSDIIAGAQAGVEPYASTPAWQLLGSPASPVDPLYHLAHPTGYEGSLMENELFISPDPEGRFVTPPGGLITTQEQEAPVRPPAMQPGGGLMIDPGGALEAVVAPEQVQQAVATVTAGMAAVDPWDYLRMPVTAEMEDPRMLAPTTPTLPQVFPPQVNGRTLIKTWIAGPPGYRRQFWLFYVGNRKYGGTYKNDGSWTQWPVYKPLVIGKTMDDRKARRVAKRLDRYSKTARKILGILGYKTTRGGRSK